MIKIFECVGKYFRLKKQRWNLSFVKAQKYCILQSSLYVKEYAPLQILDDFFYLSSRFGYFRLKRGDNRYINLTKISELHTFIVQLFYVFNVENQFIKSQIRSKNDRLGDFFSGKLI